MKVFLFLLLSLTLISAMPDINMEESKEFTSSKSKIATVAHDYHLSKCIIEYAPAEESFQIMLLMFIDDLELALAKQGQTNLKLCTDHEAEKGEAFIYEYLQNSLSLSINDSIANFNFIGKEASEDYLGVWVYLEIPNVTTVENLGINCSLLTEMFDDQQNIIQVKLPNGKRGMFTFDKNKKSDSIEL